MLSEATKVGLLGATLVLSGCVQVGDDKMICERDGRAYIGRPIRSVDQGHIIRIEAADANGVAFTINQSNSHLFKCRKEATDAE